MNEDDTLDSADGEGLADEDRPASGVRTPRASEAVAARLRTRILLGEMPAGSRFPPEVDLAAEHGVSRPTIREALRILESDHLISIRRGKQGGAVVQPPSTGVLAQHAGLLLQYRQASLADVLEAKALIEPPAVGAVARRRDDDAVAQLRALLDEEATHRGNDVLAARLGQQFHELVVELAGNRTLRIYTAMVNGIISRHMSHLGTTAPEHRERLLEEHRRLVDLIEVGAAMEAEAHWREHLEHFNERLLNDIPRGTTVLDVMA